MARSALGAYLEPKGPVIPDPSQVPSSFLCPLRTISLFSVSESASFVL